MSTSPSTMATAAIPSFLPSTPSQAPSRPNRTLRKLKSAYALSSHAGNGNAPSLISLQRQQQQLQQHQQQQPQHQHQARPTLSAHKDHLAPPPPPVPPLPSHGRSRSSSDAAVTAISDHGPSARRQGVAKKLVSAGLNGGKTGTTLETLVREGPRNGNIFEGLQSMRYQVLSNGVASDTDGMVGHFCGLVHGGGYLSLTDRQSPLRIYIWLILLCAPPLVTQDYLGLIHRGPSPAYAKIRNDTFRTLATDPLFRRRVSEASLIRLLNAVAWTLHDTKEGRSSTSKSPVLNVATSDGSPELRQVTVGSKQDVPSSSAPMSIPKREGSEAGGTESGTYVQGMNVLAAPFLYAARSEAEAYVAFHRFLTLECPGYVRGAMDGVHRGLTLVDRVLGIVDSKLADYLLSKSMHAELYAFPSVLTLCACTPPLPEVLHLWDFLFAYGAHLNILCIVAQLILMRDVILQSPSPVKILRSFPPLQAVKIKFLAISLVPRIPDDVYDEIVRHAK